MRHPSYFGALAERTSARDARHDVLRPASAVLRRWRDSGAATHAPERRHVGSRAIGPEPTSTATALDAGTSLGALSAAAPAPTPAMPEPASAVAPRSSGADDGSPAIVARAARARAGGSRHADGAASGREHPVRRHVGTAPTAPPDAVTSDPHALPARRADPDAPAPSSAGESARDRSTQRVASLPRSTPITIPVRRSGTLTADAELAPDARRRARSTTADAASAFPTAHRRRPGDAGQRVLRIGSIEVTVTPPTPALPVQPPPLPATTRASTSGRPLARGFTTALGLRQG